MPCWRRRWRARLDWLSCSCCCRFSTWAAGSIRPEGRMLKPADFPERLTLQRALFQAAMLALLMVLSLSLYLAVLKWRGPAVVWVTRTEWDRLLPFQPIWVWVYLI